MGRDLYFESFGYKTLADALTKLRVDDLRERVKFLGLKTGTRKDDQIAAIVKHLSGQRLREIWDRMDPLTRYAVAEAVHCSIAGGYDERQFAAKYGGTPPRLKRRYYGDRQSHPMTVFDVLFTNEHMPLDLIALFSEFVPEPPLPSLKSRTELPDKAPDTCWPSVPLENHPDPSALEEVHTETAALHDVIAALRFIDTGKASVGATTGKASLATAKAICAVLRDGDFVPHEAIDKADELMRAVAWPLLIQSAGLARIKSGKLALTTAGRKALTEAPQNTLKHIWNQWIKKSKFDEFSRINEIKGQKSKGRYGLTPVIERRVAVVEALEECPVGEWVYIDDFFTYFEAAGIRFEVTNNPWKLYLCEPQYGSLGYDGCHAFSLLQGRYIMALLWEYAATLGMLDIAYIDPNRARSDFRDLWGAQDLRALSRYDGLKFFRLTPLGAYCLDLAESYTPKPPESRAVFLVLPNQDIVIKHPEAFRGADALFLERIARSTGDHTWAFDSARIINALEGGIREDEILAFLEANSIEPLPDNVRTFLADVTRRATLVAYEGPAEIYHVADEATALLIAHDSETKTLCYRAGKSRLVVPSAKATAFQKALRKLGFCAKQ